MCCFMLRWRNYFLKMSWLRVQWPLPGGLVAACTYVRARRRTLGDANPLSQLVYFSRKSWHTHLRIMSAGASFPLCQSGIFPRSVSVDFVLVVRRTFACTLISVLCVCPSSFIVGSRVLVVRLKVLRAIGLFWLSSSPVLWW